MFCLQIHARAECTMNEIFCILHEAAGAECSIQNFEFIVHSASACICKENTNLTVTHLIYNLSSLLVLASKSRKLSLTKQNKTNAILKTLYAKKVQQI